MASRLRDQIEAVGGWAAFFRLDPPGKTDLDNFQATYPVTAARIAAAGVDLTVEKEEPRRFELGSTFYQKLHQGVGMGADTWRALADRHSRDPAAVFDGDQVRSHYTLSDVEQNFWPKPKLWDTQPIRYGDRPVRSVKIVTQLGRENTTIMTIEASPV
jgi:hypothetical protein